MEFATSGDIAAVNARIDALDAKIEEVKSRLGIQVINHSFGKTDVSVDFSGNNTLTTGVKGCAGHTPVFAIPHDTDLIGVDIEACYLSGGKVCMRVYTTEHNRVKGYPSADVVYFKTKFVTG